MFCVLTASSQTSNVTKFSVNGSIEQQFMLNNWHNDSKYDDGLGDLGGTEINMRLNWYVQNNWGLWLQYGLVFRKKGKGFPAYLNLFNEINLNDYYVDDESMLNNNGYNGNIGLNAFLGVFYTKSIKKWNIMPHFGIGVDGVYIDRLDYSIKRKETNEAYNISYSLFEDDSYDKILANMYFQIKASTKLWKTTNLELGINYRQFLERSNITGTMMNFYDGSFVKQVNQKGNLVNTLGVSVGVSFR